MKLKYLFIGSMIGCGGLSACQDQWTLMNMPIMIRTI